MTHHRLACALLALALLPTASVFAQGNSRRERDDSRNSNNCRNDSSRCVGNRDRQPPEQPAWRDDRRDNRRDDRHDDRGNGRWDQQRYERPDYRGDYRGAGPYHAYYRGNRMPPQYRTYQYVVEDWRGHGLYSPPRGYHWVQTGNDYVLVAIATGIILELLLGN